MDLRVSLVTPSFNQRKWLPHTIDSVIKQKCSNLQYIVMDGGSSDGSAQIISEYAGKLHANRAQKDAGQYDAINKGFLLSDGDIMGWLNSDDLHLPWTLSIVTEIFAAFPQIQWLTSSFPLLVDAEGNAKACREAKAFSRHGILRGETLDVSHGFVVGVIQQEGTFWRRNLWEQAGGRLETEFDYAADFDLWMRFAKLTDIFSVNVPLACFRQHETQKTSRDMARYRTQASESFRRHGQGFSNRRLRLFARQYLPRQLRRLATKLGWLYPAKVVKQRGHTGHWMIQELLV